MEKTENYLIDMHNEGHAEMERTMSFLDCEARRKLKLFPVRDDGKSCKTCDEFKSVVNIPGEYQRGPCKKLRTNKFSFEYCEHHSILRLIFP